MAFWNIVSGIFHLLVVLVAIAVASVVIGYVGSHIADMLDTRELRGRGRRIEQPGVVNLREYRARKSQAHGRCRSHSKPEIGA